MLRPPFICLAAACGVALAAGTAGAQDRRPTIVVPSRARPAITGYAPDSGPPGTVVTVTGERFSPRLVPLFRGRPVELTYADESTLQFAIPDGAGRGPIAIRDPSRGDLAVGDFDVTPAFDIRAFAPRSGPPGTRVEISGTGFEPSDEVRLADQPVAVVDVGPSRIIIQIRPGARTGPLSVLRPRTGAVARTGAPFVVTAPAPPFITGTSPAGGPPGTRVRVSGGNFGADDRLFYGGRPVQIIGRDDDFFDAVVPPEARESERFYVRGPRGEAASPTPFRLGRDPVVRGFRPESGPAGTEVELFGDDLADIDEVQLDRKSLAILDRREHRVAVRIPAGASSGPFVLVRAGRPVAQSQTAFAVARPVRPPVVSGFYPSSGPPGTTVTITGDGFAPDVRVAYADQPLTIVARQGDDGVTVTVPRSATRSAPFVVSTGGGQTRSGSSFQLQLGPTIDSITPTSGPPGTPISIRGSGFRGDEQFYLEDRPLRVVERQSWGYVVEAPRGGGGQMSVDSAGQHVVLPFRFDVVSGPAIESFEPVEGPPGTQVVIRGHGVGRATQVIYGGLPCPIVRRDRGEIVVEIPADAAGRDVFWVEAFGQRARSAEAFRVTLPGPSIGAFSPREGRPGTEVALEVAGLSPRAEIWFGDEPCRIVDRDPRRIIFVVPHRAFGRGPFTIVDEGRRYTTAQFFEVEGWRRGDRSR